MVSLVMSEMSQFYEELNQQCQKHYKESMDLYCLLEISNIVIWLILFFWRLYEL